MSTTVPSRNCARISLGACADDHCGLHVAYRGEVFQCAGDRRFALRLVGGQADLLSGPR